jgi:hypothetical protein
LIGALLAAAVMAVSAPAPRVSGTWGRGWDKPVGDGRYDRKGDKLIVTITPESDTHLLREARGDFAVEVRLGGNLSPELLHRASDFLGRR